MGGKSKKKSSKKDSSQKPPKYVVAPASPVVTRSSAKEPAETSKPAASKDPAPRPVHSSPLAEAAEGASASPFHVSLEDLGARMSQIESAVRSVLTTASTFAAPAAPQSVPIMDAVPAVTAKTAESAPAATRRSRQEDLGVSSRRRRRHNHHHDSSTSSSSSSSSASSSRSARSSSESVSPARSSHRSRRKQDRRDKKRKGKYDTSKFLREGDKLNTYERLVLANLKMVRKLYKKDRDILGFLDHMILVAEKAERRVFASEALISYDESVKDAAKENGLKAFAVVDPANIVKHLSYDGTQVAVNSRRSNATRQSSSASKGPNLNHNFACIKFNFAQGGCKEGRSCRYKHICSACGGSGHSNGDCPNVDRERSSSKK